MGSEQRSPMSDKSSSKGGEMQLEGTIVRFDRSGLGVILSTGTQYPFTFDKLEGYRGEQPGEFGIREGCSVTFSVDAAGLVVKSVFLSSSR